MSFGKSQLSMETSFQLTKKDKFCSTVMASQSGKDHRVLVKCSSHIEWSRVKYHQVYHFTFGSLILSQLEL